MLAILETFANEGRKDPCEYKKCGQEKSYPAMMDVIDRSTCVAIVEFDAKAFNNLGSALFQMGLRRCEW